MKSAFSPVVFIIFFITLSSVANKVKAATCQDPLGGCPQCNERCKAKHGPTGHGSCDRNQLCTCYYTCGSSPTPPVQKKQCYGGADLCSDDCLDKCCDTNCFKKYNAGHGSCLMLGNFNVCECEYTC